MDDLILEFIAESQEGLDRMERCLTDLETRPKDNAALIAEIFRTVHTIKGTTGFLGFCRLEKLAHAGEHLLGSLRDGKLLVTEALISGLLQLLDGLRNILQIIEETGGEGTRVGDEDTALIKELNKLNLPSAYQITTGRGDQIGLGGSVEESQDIVPQLPNGSHSLFASNDKTLRIDIDVLNRMMNLVGELVLTRNQILQSGASHTNFAELSRRLDSVTVDLRETVMQARMQPVGNLFAKFPRMVRDLSRICGREVRIEFFGQETGLDKGLLEAIKDPLTHAVRNAIDHGIEPAVERVLAGKPSEGRITLKAFHQGGSVIIEVRDDGAGISMQRLLNKAIERGLVTKEQAAEMNEREAFQLIFLPGFSTASAITTVSGRGVGMDVVRANVEKVGGSVELESKLGLGTTLRLRVPLTLAIIPALVVRSGGQNFALPQTTLMELVYIPLSEVSGLVENVGGAAVYRLRERLLPLVWLDRLLGLETSANPHGFYIAVLEAEGCRYGLVVDNLLAPEEIVVKPLSSVLREIGLFSGATVLGNGMLALIVDVAATAARAAIKPLPEAEKEEATCEIDEDKEYFLAFEAHSKERTVLPLRMVERIELVPVCQIEYSRGRPLLQYRGELLDLLDNGGLISYAETSPNSNSTLTVLICRNPDSEVEGRIGIIVHQVLDVSYGKAVQRDATSNSSLVMVNEKVSTLLHGVRANQWKEVA